MYRKQVDELEDELAATYDKLENAKTEVAREIFEEIENAKYTILGLQDIVSMGDIEELKKKYTEQCPKCKHFVGCDPYKIMFYKTSGESCDEYKEEKT